MNVFYKMSYRVGFHPWEDLAHHKPFADALMGLFEREERGKEPPYGKALDLGCGQATWGVPLARRGWQVTGVDNVPKAVARAQEHIREAGVDIRAVVGDVTHDLESAVGSGYDLVVDTGTFHGLNPEQRLAMGREVTAITSRNATLILDCFAPRNRGPLPRGCTRGDVEEAFPDWVITDVVDADTDPDPVAKAFKFSEVFYRLSRAPQPADR
ncbi:class I SAM-dependent methyltransferase [Nocardioides limicola]|uniref:class I SAM-dependent methyltransferase n=1 Tax=Nocardioides limicola TaxID=2803368 RepID=UPI00193C5BD6|nr:class I SAM-dependent methyltransferase [Nocardioides sp. DJM-14]